MKLLTMYFMSSVLYGLSYADTLFYALWPLNIRMFFVWDKNANLHIHIYKKSNMTIFYAAMLSFPEK